MAWSQRDTYAGLLLTVVGLFVAYKGSHYEIGGLTDMGPGFFPAALGALLAVMGVAIALAARSNEAEAAQAFRVEWRGWSCIVAAVVAFIVLVQFVGFAAAAFATVFIAAMGDRQATWKTSAALAFALTVFGVLVFSLGLQVEMPIFHGLNG